MSLDGSAHNCRTVANLLMSRVRSPPVLKSLLFLIYVNDMSSVVSNKLLLYADDSEIRVADKHISNIETFLKKELEVVSDWLIDSKLSLHRGKTELILFRSKIKLKTEPNLRF